MPGTPMTSDSEFEKVLADLAFATLQDKAPGIVDYLVGFQVLDVNDDQSRAVGIFGAKAGNEWIYVPVFFINGELKIDMAYLKNQDIFCPLIESWLTYVLNRKPAQMGEATDATPADLAGGGLDMAAIQRSPQSYGKIAAAPAFKLVKRGHRLDSVSVPAWGRANPHPAYPDMKAVAHRAVSEPRYKTAAYRLDLCRVLSGCRVGAVARFAGELVKNAGLRESVLSFYPVERITSIRPQRVKTAAAPALPDVRILTYKERNAYDQLDLDDNDRSKLMAGEIVIKDNRDDTSKIYRLSRPLNIQPPSTSGIYKVLLKDGTLTRCLVIVNPITLDNLRASSSYMVCPEPRRRGMSQPTGQLQLVNLEGDGAWKGPLNAVYAQPVGDGLLTGLSHMTEGSKVSEIAEGSAYALVDARGTGTRAFHVCKKLEADDGTIRLFVTEELDPYEGADENWSNQCEVTVIPGKTGTIKELGKILVVPAESVRAFKVTVKKAKRDSDGRRAFAWIANGGMPEPGDPAVIERMVWSSDQALPLKIYSTGTEYDITIGNTDGSLKTASPRPPMAALRHLVMDLGIRGDHAMDMIKQADADSVHRRPTRFLIKLAKGYPCLFKSAQPGLIDGAPSAPGWDEAGMTYDSNLGVPATTPGPMAEVVSGMQPDQNAQQVYNPDPRLDQNIYSAVNQAAATGQKEVFDTAMIAGLVNSSDTDSMVDRYMGDLILGMDRIGRIYFMFLQHFDDFKERYGQEGMMEMEDNLKNTFKAVGDLILLLKQKTAEESKSQDKTMTV